MKTSRVVCTAAQGRAMRDLVHFLEKLKIRSSWRKMSMFKIMGHAPGEFTVEVTYNVQR